MDDVSGCALVLIDLQERLIPVIDEAEVMVREAIRLANLVRLLGAPVIGTQQNPRQLGRSIEHVKSLCTAGLAKRTFDACASGLIELLPPDTTHVLLAGCESHVCVYQTALGMLERNLHVTVVGNAVGSRRKIDLESALANVVRSGADVATTEMIVFQWLRTADHPKFRSAMKLIR